MNFILGEEVGWCVFLCVGVNDWGGILSGVTSDYVNVEALWSYIEEFVIVCVDEGFVFVLRLLVYFKYLRVDDD